MKERSLATLKIRILHDGLFAMGPGKADLLEAIQADPVPAQVA